MSCRRCRHDEEAREEWGCDRELEEPLVELECHVCDGSGTVRPGVDCTACEPVHHDRAVVVRRCPMAVLPAGIHRVVQSVCAYDSHGTLPSAGGWEDQCATWHAATGLLLSERRAYEDEAREVARQRAEANR